MFIPQRLIIIQTAYQNISAQSEQMQALTTENDAVLLLGDSSLLVLRQDIDWGWDWDCHIYILKSDCLFGDAINSDKLKKMKLHLIDYTAWAYLLQQTQHIITLK